MMSETVSRKYFYVSFYMVCVAAVFLWTKYVLSEYSPIVSLVLPAALFFLALGLMNIEYGITVLILFSVLGSGFGFHIKSFLPQLYAVQLMVISLATLVSARRLYTKDCSMVSSKVNPPILLLFAWSIITVIGNFVTGATDALDLVHQADNILLWFIALLAFFIISNEIKDERGIQRSVYLVIISSIPYLILYFVRLISVGDFELGYEHRVFSSFLGVHSGAYLMIIFILLLNHIAGFKQYRPAMIVLLMLVLSALITTYWRTSLIATAAATVTTMAPRFKRLSLVLFLGVAVVVLYFAGTGKLQLAEYREGISSEIRESEEAPLMQGRFARIVLFTDALDIIKKHPFFGTGMDMYGKYTTLKYLDRNLYEIRPMPSAHNEYLQVMVSVGVIGLPLFLWLLYAAFRETSLLAKNTKPFQRYLGVSFRNVLIGVVVYSFGFQSILNTFGDGYFQSLSCSVYFWIICGLVVAANNSGSSDMNSVRV